MWLRATDARDVRRKNECARRIQALCRGHRVREMIKRWNAAAVDIERVARGHMGRRIVAKMRGHIAMERAARVFQVRKCADVCMCVSVRACGAASAARLRTRPLRQTLCRWHAGRGRRKAIIKLRKASKIVIVRSWRCVAPTRPGRRASCGATRSSWRVRRDAAVKRLESAQREFNDLIKQGYAPRGARSVSRAAAPWACATCGAGTRGGCAGGLSGIPSRTSRLRRSWDSYTTPLRCGARWMCARTPR